MNGMVKAELQKSPNINLELLNARIANRKTQTTQAGVTDGALSLQDQVAACVKAHAIAKGALDDSSRHYQLVETQQDSDLTPLQDMRGSALALVQDPERPAERPSSVAEELVAPLQDADPPPAAPDSPSPSTAQNIESSTA